MTDSLLLPAAFVLSFLGTWLLIRLSNARHWLDVPNSRSSHSTPTPTAGGLAFALIFMVAVLLAFRETDAGFNTVLLVFMAAGILVLGLSDDLFSLGIGSRISTQALLVAGALALFGLPSLPLPGISIEGNWVMATLFFCGYLWFINLFNFMDGIDGLAASESIFICLAVFLLSRTTGDTSTSTLLLLLVAVLSGFLLLNFPPARIFMGDTGSNFLGYMLGMLALASTGRGETNIWVWCILAGMFIVDATWTLFARMLNRETWYHAHRTHAYQLAADHWGSHGKVLMVQLLINCTWLLPLAWLAQTRPQWGLVLTVVAWGVLAIMVCLIRRSLPRSAQP